MTLDELIARWETGEGKPFKGRLIDMDAYGKDPTNPGCMCAQGQVLHDLGGWSAEALTRADQLEADRATAKLLNISRAHAILLRRINDNADGAPAIVLTDPEKVLGDQRSRVLDFWWHLDGMTPDQLTAARAAARDAAWAAARAAARDAARAAARDAAWDAAGDAAWAAAGATNEIQGASVLRARGRSFFFLPMFGFSSPEEIPARPDNYGRPQP